MKRIVRNTVRAALLAAACIAAAGCATGKAATGGITRDGATFRAQEVKMVATESWGNATRIAEFTPGIMESGVESIEVMMPYGETAAVWHFTGLTPDAPVEFVMDVNFDFFMSDSFVEIHLLPGLHGAAIGTWPKPDWVEDAMTFKWIDSVGRFAGEPWPDATDGWETVRHTEAKADGNGEFTVVVMFNHYSENPPLVFNYITNPEVKTFGGGE